NMERDGPYANFLANDVFVHLADAHFQVTTDGESYFLSCQNCPDQSDLPRLSNLTHRIITLVPE
ncbi:MAG: hypothetical protein AAFU67_19325, partial [Bacteroidota bacterium]